MKKNQYKDGKQHGLWETYYPTIMGELTYKGKYKDGEPHGYWESYLNTKITRDNVLIQFFI
jgi:antitoxin component YwqK of YwqJK toxin-antitoxin module